MWEFILFLVEINWKGKKEKKNKLTITRDWIKYTICWVFGLISLKGKLIRQLAKTFENKIEIHTLSLY